VRGRHGRHRSAAEQHRRRPAAQHALRRRRLRWRSGGRRRLRSRGGRLGQRPDPEGGLRPARPGRRALERIVVFRFRNRRHGSSVSWCGALACDLAGSVAPH
jgi:hypothetical protein